MLRVAYLGVVPLPGRIAANGLPKVSETLLREYEHCDSCVQVDEFTFTSEFMHEYQYRRAMSRTVIFHAKAAVKH